ncbi:uncharacterized protein FIBRA_06742 [Fibroporia radiculosa]|uniref:triacylglycerol lipase n=1 Tax=Fibroporia radiculosa TaxID=599839 RepID=J4IBF3_9APHY|nr:uncharacterized protein FIBRA_06742 [Fibroporia radiculosa]CCM04561.1 predicted protein [Fibroporia radiculosa]
MFAYSALSLPNALQYLLASLLWQKTPLVESPSLRFELRHEHGLSQSARPVFSDVRSPVELAPQEYTLNTRPLQIYKPTLHANLSSDQIRGLSFVPWNALDTEGPDVRDRETLLMLAKMANNAYQEPADKEWYHIGSDWNSSYPFGWEPNADGLRGHIFATPDNSTVVITVKGTDTGWLTGGGGPTLDLLGPQYAIVMKVVTSVIKNLYYNVSYMYPSADIWLVGHSLGGSLASLIGVTFGAPVVAFEAPAEKLAAQRLHLPSPPSTQHVTHVYHTADPIPMGVCNGVSSACAIGGYAMETRCHLGNIIRYDTVSKLGWGVSVRNHGIRVIVDMLSAEWDSDNPGAVPDLFEEEDCVDCFNWEFGHFRNASVAACADNV